MTNFTKPFSMIMFSAIISSTVVAMEKEVTHTLMICHNVPSAVYGTSTYHTRYTPQNLPSTIKDPVVQCIITDSVNNTVLISPIIAAKYLFNANAKEPLLTLKLKLGRNKDSLHIVTRCIKNPELKEDTFLEQLKNKMQPLYEFSNDKVVRVYTERPEDLLFSIDSYNDFIKAGVAITKQENGKTIWMHGPNGCPNEEALIKAQFKDVVQPKLPFIYWFLKNYQCNQQELPEDIVQLIAIALQLQPSMITIIK